MGEGKHIHGADLSFPKQSDNVECLLHLICEPADGFHMSMRTLERDDHARPHSDDFDMLQIQFLGLNRDQRKPFFNSIGTLHEHFVMLHWINSAERARPRSSCIRRKPARVRHMSVRWMMCRNGALS